MTIILYSVTTQLPEWVYFSNEINYPAPNSVTQYKYSRPPNIAALGNGEKTAVLKNGGKGIHITEKKRIRDL